MDCLLRDHILKVAPLLLLEFVHSCQGISFNPVLLNENAIEVVGASDQLVKQLHSGEVIVPKEMKGRFLFSS